jgi:hypothetical protein
MFKLFATKEDTTHTTNTGAVTEGMTLEQVRTAMLQLMKEESSNHHRMGQLYNYVVDKRLAEKAGYKDVHDYFSQHLADLSQAALTMYGVVAKAFSEPVARRYGVTCLSLLVTYKEVADIEVNFQEPGATLIDVPDDKGEVVSTKPLPPEVEQLADQYREAVTGRFTKGTRVKVVVRNEKGEAVLDFKGIPLAQVRQLAAALTEELPPVREVRFPGKPAVG